MRNILYKVKIMLSPLTLSSLLLITVLRAITSYPFMKSEPLAGLMLDMYGGVSWNMFITFREIAYWIMFLLPYLFGIVQYYSHALQKNLNLTLYRSKSKSSWWAGEMIAVAIYVLVLTVLSVIISLSVGFVGGLRNLQMYLVDASGFYAASSTRWILAPVMAFFNALLFSWLYTITYLIWRDTRISTFIYIVPTVIMLLLFSNEERTDRLSSLINWSMVQRYPLLEENGLPEIQVISFFLLAVVVVFIIGMITAVCVNPFHQDK